MHHQLWYKRPDWFAVVDVPRLYQETDLRLSYVLWQEGVSPFVVVELLSPGTEQEDLGQVPKSSEANRPPSKWQIYEQILRVPYYIVFDRYRDQLQAFHLVSDRYEALDLPNHCLWIPSLKIGLGTWQGSYQGIERLWLRWFDQNQVWIPTAEEHMTAAAAQAAAAEQALRQAQQRAERLAKKLRSLGIDSEDV